MEIQAYRSGFFGEIWQIFAKKKTLITSDFFTGEFSPNFN
jgi:hypothetical protein